MKILVTGANGFVGKNLTNALYNIKNGKDKTRQNLSISEVFCYDVDCSDEQLEKYAKQADFIFNLAGVNRPKDPKEFMTGNFGFSQKLLELLIKSNNKCPIMLSSSVQASLEGRFADGEYGKSKKAGEQLFFNYGEKTGAKVHVYRFPNLFGKWCKPNYNSVIATFCYNIARDIPIVVSDENVCLELLYIDDLIEAMLDLLEGKEKRCEYNGLERIDTPNGKFCFVEKTHSASLGEIVRLLREFERQPKTLLIPEIKSHSFAKKLYSTYLSYLPKEKIAFPLKMNVDERGSFTELLKTVSGGQFSVNVSKPGITKGQHWHNSKWEFFIVVSGQGLIEQRKIGTKEILRFEVNGEKPTAVHMLPGYTHNIINLSKTENLITLMWANETFDKEKPDTFYEEV